jgi:hypothetical protein
MADKISTFQNNDGETVHAVFIDTKLADGRTIERHNGTFATHSEAVTRMREVEAGWKPSFWEDEPE